jgi:hypothetical protein
MNFVPLTQAFHFLNPVVNLGAWTGPQLTTAATTASFPAPRWLPRADLQKMRDDGTFAAEQPPLTEASTEI